MLGSGIGVPYENSYQFWDPLMLDPATGGLSIWLKHDSKMDSSSGSYWNDSSGNGNDATQSVVGDRATYSGGGFDFEAGEGDHYDFDSAINIAEEEGFVMFLVCQVESVGSNMTVLGLNSTTHFLEFKAGGDNVRIRLGSTTTDIAPDSANEFHSSAGKFILTLVRESGGTGNLVLYKNGTVLAQSSQASNSGDAEFGTLGVRNADRFFDGIIYEFILYENETDWNDVELEYMHEYLKSIHSL
jgi:hypothetical protein